MNLFFVFRDGRVVTPALTGTILEGVTRDSVLQLARDAGYETEERPISIEEWRDTAASGELSEVFACGTAAVITPVGVLCSENERIVCTPESGGEVGLTLRTRLLDLQYGRSADDRGWLTRLA